MTPEGFKTSYRGLLPNSPRETRPLSEDESVYFINSCMVDLERVDDDFRESLNNLPAIGIINGKLEHLGVQLDVKTKAFLGCVIFAQRTAVLWAFTLARLALELGRNPTFEDLFTDLSFFGSGVPTESKLEEAWEVQKYESYNLVDRAELWPNMRPKSERT